MTPREPVAPCPWCGCRRTPVHVHGHAQCAICGTNIEPCCDGAGDQGELRGDGASRLAPSPDLFRRLFDRLGGCDATVTEQALVFALAENQGTDIAGAQLLLEAGRSTGRIEQPVPGCYRLPR